MGILDTQYGKVFQIGICLCISFNVPQTSGNIDFIDLWNVRGLQKLDRVGPIDTRRSTN